mmetsp:Transcript_25759/g.61350  ORF Transcript_25759/g.61350 Transcript_25759/m.61350 type:complete len:316 (-) Transcript_25759:241-1188(-)
MENLTEAEAAVYDRQLRVWGIETQKRINNCKALIAGITGLAAETAKNLVLAGVGHLTLLDSTPVGEVQTCNFLVMADAPKGKSIAQASSDTLRDMNPLVTVEAMEGQPEDVANKEQIGGFDVVILFAPSLEIQERWDAWTTELDVPFFVGSSRGPGGFLFCNLHAHSFSASSGGGEAAAGAESAELQFCGLGRALSAGWGGLRRRCHKMFFSLSASALFERRHGRPPVPGDEEAALDLAVAELAGKEAVGKLSLEDLRSFLQSASAPPMPAVSAVLGGILAQEALKAVSRKGEPIRNFFFFSLEDGAGTIETIGC